MNPHDDVVLANWDWLRPREVRLEIEGPIDPQLIAIMCGLEGAYDAAEERKAEEQEREL